MKTYKQFIIERRPFFAVANDYIPRRRDKDKDDMGYDPDSEGEDQFQDYHKDNTQKHDHPVELEPSKSKVMKQAKHQPMNGERDTPKQGSSSVNVPYKAKSGATANNREGETVLKKIKGYKVQVSDNVNVKDFKEDTTVLTFENGETREISEELAQSLENLYYSLNESNQAIFQQQFDSVESFDQLVQFVEKV